MRISRFGLLSCTAALGLVSALPCLGQSASTITPVKAQHASQLNAASASLLKIPEDIQQQVQQNPNKAFSAKAFPKIRIIVPGTLAQRECYNLQVFRFEQGYPEKGATAQPSVSTCESAARIHLKNLVTGVPVLQPKLKH